MLRVFGVLVLVMLLVIAGSCSQVERDHVWVVDQNGQEVSVEGTWEVVEASHPNTHRPEWNTVTLPPDATILEEFMSEGIYTDGDDIIWTQVNVSFKDGRQVPLLERMDTSVVPNRLYMVFRTNADGSLVAEYGEHPFDAPEHNVLIFERR